MTMPGDSEAGGRAPVDVLSLRTPRALAPLLDHTVLRPEATRAEVHEACLAALRYRFAGVCVRAEHVAEVARLLQGSGVRAIAVVDFPKGEGSRAARVAEAAAAAAWGAVEIDVVAPLPALRAADHRAVFDDLSAVGLAAHTAALKVILETATLTAEQKVAGAALAAAAGAAYVKTSTGLAGGATEEDVRLLRATVGPGVGVKASGGIRTALDALRMVRAGASRVGCSASVAIAEAASF